MKGPPGTDELFTQHEMECSGAHFYFMCFHAFATLALAARRLSPWLLLAQSCAQG